MGKFLFHIARCKIMGSFVGLIFAYFPFLVPVKKIMQNKKAVAFKHPSPAYPNHILIIPRKIARNMFCLSEEDFLGVIEMAVKIRLVFKNDDSDSVVLINGGKKQDVMQAHFHLFAGNIAAQKDLSKEIGNTFISSDGSDKTDKIFWEQIVSNLHNLLKQYNISETSFSMVIQFEKAFDPTAYTVYFV